MENIPHWFQLRKKDIQSFRFAILEKCSKLRFVEFAFGLYGLHHFPIFFLIFWGEKRELVFLFVFSLYRFI
jgi:hypothetical protein